MWAGQLTMRVGSSMLAVAYDTAATAETLRHSCAAWLTDDDSSIVPAFGIRTAKVGFRRKQVGVIHHGAPVRYRCDRPERAVEVLVSILAEMEREPVQGLEPVDARVYLKDGRAILADVRLSASVDVRELKRLGVVEVPSWRPLVDMKHSSVRVSDQEFPLDGLIVTWLKGHLNVTRRHWWQLGEHGDPSWAEFIDALGDRVLPGQPELSTAETIRSAFSEVAPAGMPQVAPATSAP